MDISALTIVASIIIALTGIIPGTLALIKQGRKDDKEAKLAEAKLQFDINTATNTALASVITPLKEELARCQARIIELERALVDKTKEIGQLIEEGIDKDSQIRTLQFNIEGMQMKLDAVYKKRPSKVPEDILNPSHLDEELKSNELRKEEAKKYTSKVIQEIESKSIKNGHTPVIQDDKPENE